MNFFKTAFPDFEVRGEGKRADGKGRWVHFGTPETYIAINEGRGAKEGERYEGVGINHVGFVVDDIEGVGRRLKEAGYQRSYPVQNQRFRIRDYFLDADGNEYEFVQYLSDKPEERNDYSE